MKPGFKTNTPLTFIIPPSDHLLEELKGFSLFGYYSTYSDFIETVMKMGDKINSLRGHFIDSYSSPLSFLPLQNIPINTNVYLYCESIGDLTFIFENIDLLRTNYQIMLPAGHPNSYTSLKMLSSLGINCSLDLDTSAIDWDKFDQLAKYIYKNDIPHGKIEPFTYILENYNPKEYLDYNVSLLNTPLWYLFIDEELNVYPSHSAMCNKQKIGTGKDFILNFQNSQQYMDLKFKWKDLFISMNACSTCPAFRICLGKFVDTNTNMTLCRSTFSNIMELVENIKKNVPLIKMNV
jgi:radical SAM protein with 4Fe4S-binding SPASM domain